MLKGSTNSVGGVLRSLNNFES